jgi:hypothetical protein
MPERLESLALPGLGVGLIDLENLDPCSQITPPLREAIEARAENYILPNGPCL